jgi:hypothetical protein
MWLTSLRLEHKIALLMQCEESVIDVGVFSDISLISDAMPISVFVISNEVIA